jgi:predicted nicotinamide N-methyase
MSFPLELRKVYLQQKTVELFVPDPRVVREKYVQGDMPFPYWSQVWPAAIALSEFLLAHTHFFQNKKVIELAAGLGLPSVVAAPYASEVLCSDYLPEAVEAIGQSAAHNGFKNFSTALLNWHVFPKDLAADVWLLSDINYDPEDFDVLQKLIERFLQAGATVILSTPQRLMAKEFVAPLLFFCRQQQEITVRQAETETRITVLVLQP